MKTKLSNEVKINASLMFCALAAGFVFISGLAPDSGFEDEETVEAFDVATALNRSSPASSNVDRFLPPVDHREYHYIKLRESAKILSDGDVLMQYREAWEAAQAFKSATGGFGLPEYVAEDKAMPMHALWREIQQRGLATRVVAPEFRSVWAYLVTDGDGV